MFVLVAVLAIALTAFWFSRSADVSFDELKTTVPHSEYSKFADINGVRIHYQEKGKGVPIVLIHGYTSSTHTWKDVFEPLSEKYRVIALDLKGFGFSGKPKFRRSKVLPIVIISLLLTVVAGGVWWMMSGRENQTAVDAPVFFEKKDITSWNSTPGELFSSGTFSPDGKTIAYLSNRDGVSNIRQVATDGSNDVQITNNNDEKLLLDCPIWSNDDSQIAFYSKNNRTRCERKTN